MKKFKLLSVSFAFLLSFVFISGYASASTPTLGWHWPSSDLTYYNDGGTPWYSGIWDTGASRWDNTNDVYLSQGTYNDFRVGKENAGNVYWDGMTYSTHSGGITTKIRAYVNTYYTSQSQYTTSVCDGITTHELGHTLGLADEYNDQSSVMFGDTFENGIYTRTTTYPSSADKSAVLGLYGGVTYATKKPVPVSTPNVITSSTNYVTEDPSWAEGYPTIKDLAKNADLIVQGTIGDKSEFKKDANNGLFSYRTNRSIIVSNVLKGDPSIKNTTVTFDQLGGVDPEATVVSDASTPLQKDNKVILFLRKNGDVYSLLNENVSIFLKNENSGDFKSLKDNTIYALKDLISNMK